MKTVVCAAALSFAALAVAAAPQVAITRYPSGITEVVGGAVEQDDFVVTNAGPGTASIRMVPNRTSFEVTPSSLDLPAGKSATIAIRPATQKGGFYSGAVSVFVDGVATPLIVPVRIFIGQQPSGTVNPVASSTTLIISGLSGAAHPGSIGVTNFGNVTMQGMLAPHVPWIEPQSDLMAIAPSANVQIPFVIDTTERPDAIYPLGAVFGTMSMLYLKGIAPGVLQSGAINAQVFDISKVSVVPSQPAAADASENILFLPGVTDAFGFFTDVFLSNRSRATLPSDVKLFHTAVGAPPATSLLANVGRLPASIAAWFPFAPSSIFNIANQTGTIQLRTPDASKVALAALGGNTPDGVNRYLTAMPVLSSQRAIASGDRLLLPGVDKSTTAHTDVFVQETTGIAGEYKVDFFDEHGAAVGASRTGALLPFGTATVTDAVPAGARSARVSNTSSSAARVTAFARVIDESTLDAWTIVDSSRSPGPTSDLVLPVPSLTGAPTSTVFDIWITNGSSSAASVTLGTTAMPAKSRAVHRNGAATNPVETLQLAPLETRRVTKTNAPLGFVRISAPAGAISAAGRLTSTASGRRGSFGTGVPAIPAAHAIAAGALKRFSLAGDFPNVSPPTLLLLEVASRPATVRVTVAFNFPAGATITGQTSVSKDFDIAAGQRLAIPDVVRSVFGDGRDALGNVWNVVVDVEVLRGDGRILPYLQTIDTPSGDLTLTAE